MRPPEFERTALLHEVIDHATHQLTAPIEGIEIIGDRVDCWSDQRSDTKKTERTRCAFF
jgi:hypothetical protein